MLFMAIYIMYKTMTCKMYPLLLFETFHRRWMRLGFMPAHPSFYCHKEIYERYGGFNLSYKIAADFECLLRLIFVHKIRLRYIPMDFVTMRTGGASTSGLSSHKQICEITNGHSRIMEFTVMFCLNR